MLLLKVVKIVALGAAAFLAAERSRQWECQASGAERSAIIEFKAPG